VKQNLYIYIKLLLPIAVYAAIDQVPNK